MNARSFLRTRAYQIGLVVTLLAVVASIFILRKSRQEAPRAEADTKTSSIADVPTPPAYILPPVALPGRFPKADLEVTPFDPNKVEDFNPDNRLKAGHWATVITSITSTERDAQARLSAYMTSVRGERIPVLGTNRWLNANRAISLPKGQWKQVETTTFVTPRTDLASNSATFHYDLMFDRSERPVESVVQPTILLGPSQFLLCVLDQRPSRFRFLERLDCIAGFDPRLWSRLPVNLQVDTNARPEALYHCVYSRTGEPAPWPHSALTATAIAHLVWSDFDPAALDFSRQTALIDWLHWGGNLIISGPTGLERLQGSFLGPYLPAEIDRRDDISSDELKQFLAPWSAFSPEFTGAIPGCRLKLLADAQAVGESQLLSIRTIGRGRIVATGFALNTQELLNWPCYSNFVNGALLGKFGRRIEPADSPQGSSGATAIGTDSMNDRSRLWYLNRDVRLSSPPADSILNRYGTIDLNSVVQYQLGSAAWNDSSAIPQSVGEILRRRATIPPPSALFVLKVLGAYLVLLIPINWAVFRLMGRLEWAWVAAPLISIFGAVAVTRLVALDIGFTRAKDTIAVLELHGGHPRGHLAEYSALYSSLSTNFRFEFDQNDALMLPMLVSSQTLDRRRRTVLESSTYLPVNCARAQKTEINNYSIRSNTAGYLHSERMIDAGGAISLQTDPTGQSAVVDNSSALPLHHVVVLRRVGEQLQAAQIERLDPGAQSATLEFAPLNDQGARQIISRWQTDAQWPFKPADSVGLFDALLKWQPADGEARLIGMCARELSPMTCRPAPTRSVTATIVAVSLRTRLPPPESDDPNLWSKYEPLDLEAEELLPPEDETP